MTCKDCIHEKVCNDRLEQMGVAILLDSEIPKCGCKVGDGFKNKADFVEVVRCKDCLYYEPNPYNKEEMVCRCYADWSFPEPNDFCSHGERKEE